MRGAVKWAAIGIGGFFGLAAVLVALLMVWYYASGTAAKTAAAKLLTPTSGVIALGAAVEGPQPQTAFEATASAATAPTVASAATIAPTTVLTEAPTSEPTGVPE